MPNHLIHSTSPYLLQHAHNPVDWYPWGEEALEKARREDKPIFLSIGYAACHWCHVMERESFMDPEVAALMNKNFVNIKVDREERPDLDAIYMAATIAMTGGGGWPMSVFLTPDLKPFYAGTYFPPVARYNMPSFKDVLTGIARAWQEERQEIARLSSKLTQHLQASLQARPGTLFLTSQHLDALAQLILESYDWGYGGWGDAPKFPQAMTIEFLLARATQSKNAASSSKALQAALHALQAMARGGMYDVVGGGFARYSTDPLWRVPHFEKMLYDNALLTRAYLHAWQITAHPFYRRIAEETLQFVIREMSHPDGGFYSSLDADSEGEEGKFYVWTAAELRHILGNDYEFFASAYGVTENGNWEGKIVLQRARDDATLAARFLLDPEAVAAKLSECHSRLLAARSQRTRPATDDKILTAWNGLMLAAFAEAARLLSVVDGNSTLSNVYYDIAIRNAAFLLQHLRPDGQLRRAWRAGRTSAEVFLEDYAALILALLELYQTDFNNEWFLMAQSLAEEMITRFQDPAGGFFDTPADDALLLRPKDIQDNATPSGNALACEALFKLAALTDHSTYRHLAEKTLNLAAEPALRYPLAYARWLQVADFALGNGKQIAVVGEAQEETFGRMIKIIRSAYRPRVVVAASSYPPPPDAPALLMDRPPLNHRPTAYVCEGFVCKQPTTDPEKLEELLLE
ncbi:MAG: thioredoxin domain-containing protein [Anaerolineae bacterium]